VAVRTLQAAEVQHLRCEYLVNPLGIDALKPRLSWEIGERSQESEVRSQNKTEGKRRKQKQRMRGQNENRKTGKQEVKNKNKEQE
jgi:hypothetical protein